MKINVLFLAAVLTFLSLAVEAQTDVPPTTSSDYSSTTTTTTTAPDDRLFRSQELSVDLFGTLAENEEFFDHATGTTFKKNGRLGAGAGATLFFSRYVGISGDAWSENTSGRFVDNASGNLVLRLPFDAVHLAPYIFGGGGYQFDPANESFAQAGGGLDIRVTAHWGFFVDARYVIPRTRDNFGLGRAGIKIVF